jgi:hypothetical protein
LSLDLNLPKSPPLPPAADGKKVSLPTITQLLKCLNVLKICFMNIYTGRHSITI